jgi:putative ABC transport system permease protein
VATLLLAALGVFGVMGESVIRRRREIGIRVAVGARAGQVPISILREGAALALGGLLAGALGAIAVGRVLAGALYGVPPYE